MSEIDFLTSRTERATKGDTDDLRNLLALIRSDQELGENKLEILIEGCIARFNRIEVKQWAVIALLVYIAIQVS